MYNIVYLLIFVVSNHPELENQHHEWVRATLAFDQEIEDFDDLVDPRWLLPLNYMLEKIRQEEKNKFIPVSFFIILYNH